MPLMTREDKALYYILKKHDENNLMMQVEEEDFSILNNQQKEKYTADIIDLLTERTYIGAAFGYKSLEDRKKEIEEANEAAIKERSNPDPSFDAPGMDDLYIALEKENNIEKHPYFPSKDKFKQMKLDKKIKLVENLIEASTERGIGGYAYDAAASIIGAEQYGTKSEREKALYDAAKALDPMLDEYQSRNPKAAKIFQYENRDVMDKLYGNIYNKIKDLSDNPKDLPSRGEFFMMTSDEKKKLVIDSTPKDGIETALGTNNPFNDDRDEILETLSSIDQEFAKLATIDQWAEQDKRYGNIYAELKTHSGDPKGFPSRGEFFCNVARRKKKASY